MKPYLAFVTLLGLAFLFGGAATAQNTSEFAFTAAGDHGTGTRANQSMDIVAGTGSDFYLALGDLSYTAGGEQAWCSTFKSKFDDVELIAGNHDTGESTGGNINTYVRHCPFTLGSLTGDYGKQYFFDYPQAQPLARFIMIAPAIKGSVNYNYNIGGAGYNFTRDAIDQARSSGIAWIVVGMHKNCISLNYRTCEVGADLMSLLAGRRVDLILQSHDHNYQRSHQLSCIKPNTVDANCISDHGSDGRYRKGGGSVIVINGEFGVGLSGLNTSDSEAGYFANADSTTFGVSRYAISETQLSAQYLRSSGGGFADSFTISTAAPSATPVRSATPTSGTAVPTTTPGGITYAADTFTRSVADGWTSADAGGAYTLSGTAADFDVDGAGGTISLRSGGTTRIGMLRGVAARDVAARVRVRSNKAVTGSGQYAYVVLRQAGSSEYRAKLRFAADGGVWLQATRVVGGVESGLGGEVRVSGLAHSANAWIRLRALVVGTNPTTLRLRAWADGQAEPTSWAYSASDAEPGLQSAGAVGLRAYVSSSTSNAPVLVTFDDFSVTSPAP